MSDTPPANPPDDPAQIRKKLDAALTENRQLKVSNALYESGLSHLNETQRQALMLTVPKGTELTADAMKAQATALGFPLEVTPPAPPAADPSPPADQIQNNPNQPDGQTPTPPTDPGTSFLTPAPNSPHPDPRVQESITGLTHQEHAHIMGMRGGQDGGSFEEKMSKAKSKDQALAVIRQQGSGVGLMLSSDLE